MTRTEIENEMTAIAQERGEIFDELDAIAVEDDPLCGTPQHHIDALEARAAELLTEYYALWAQLDAATA
ncbi:MAG: hypothetical protein IKO05_12210 [Selenomonadaceae bacterium]|nr:hypothetical protein [Selenomonadaceae bacterium]